MGLISLIVETNIQGSISMEIQMVMGSTNGLMEMYMQECLKMGISMEKENGKKLQKVHRRKDLRFVMRVSMKVIKRMDMENSSGQVAISTKECT